MADDRKDPRGRNLKNGETFDDKTGRYRYSYIDNDGKRKQIYSWTLTKNDRIPAGKKQKSGESLREKIAVVQANIANGINSSKGNMTVYELMKLHIDLVWNDVKESTRKGYRTNLKFMEQNPFGKKKIKDVTATDAELWFNELNTKYGKGYSSLHTLRGILRPAFDRAKKNRWIYDNPFNFSLNKKRYGGTKTRDAISKADMRRFLDFVRTDKHFSKYFNGIYILFNTGLRISEFCGLAMDDIDFANHVIHVKRQLFRKYDGNKVDYYIETTKTTNGERIIPMFSDLETVFMDVLKNRPKQKKEPVVWNQDHTESMAGFLWFDKNNNLEVAQHWQNHIRWARDKFNRTYKDELPEISPHIIRHTFCSNMASAGMSPKTLQLIMGHSSIEFTLNVYTHIEAGDIKAEFINLMNNKNYDFYPLSRKPAIVSLSDEDDEEPPVDYDEIPDDDA